MYHLQHEPFLNTGLKKDMKMKVTLRSPRAGVVVERFGDKRKYLYRIVEINPLCLIKPCTTLLPLTEISANAKIIGPDGQPVPATGEYYITAETMDPYHIVTDWF
ncbi:hypothetical protein DW993_08760 [Clostridium sp. AM51-4]|nr:hypothetical protein DW993_08760 [Clostridium sp. AM51-4]